MIRAADGEPGLRALVPFTSHGSLMFSRCTPDGPLQRRLCDPLAQNGPYAVRHLGEAFAETASFTARPAGDEPVPRVGHIRAARTTAQRERARPGPGGRREGRIAGPGHPASDRATRQHAGQPQGQLDGRAGRRRRREDLRTAAQWAQRLRPLAAPHGVVVDASWPGRAKRTVTTGPTAESGARSRGSVADARPFDADAQQGRRRDPADHRRGHPGSGPLRLGQRPVQPRQARAGDRRNGSGRPTAAHARMQVLRPVPAWVPE